MSSFEFYHYFMTYNHINKQPYPIAVLILEIVLGVAKEIWIMHSANRLGGKSKNLSNVEVKVNTGSISSGISHRISRKEPR